MLQSHPAQGGPYVRIGCYLFILMMSLGADSPASLQQEQRVGSELRGKSTKDKNVSSDPVAILNRVYEMSQGALPSERAFVLQKLADTSLPTDRKLASKFARELFEASLGVAPEWMNYRRSFQAAAVRLLSRAGDLGEALEVFDRMDPPPKDAGERDVDVREGALRALLGGAMERNRREPLAWASQRVMQLAANGPYPYTAAETIIQEQLRDNSPQAEVLYAQTIDYFEKEKTKQQAREKFVDFLLAFAGKFDRSLEKQGLVIAIEANLRAQPPKDQHWSVNLTLQNGDKVSLASREDLMLFRLLPLLAKYEPQRAEEIARERTQLKTALQDGGAVKDQQAVLVVGKPDESKQRLDAVAARAQVWVQVQRVGELAARDPDQAMRLAKDINDSAARAAALAATAAGFVKKEPQRAQTLLAEALSTLEKVKDPKDRLRLLVALLAPYVAVKDDEKVGSTYADILELGDELLELELASERKFPLPMTSSYIRLSDATRTAARMNPEARLAQLSQIENNVLRWHLMIEVARTMLASRQQQPEQEKTI